MGNLPPARRVLDPRAATWLRRAARKAWEMGRATCLQMYDPSREPGAAQRIGDTWHVGAGVREVKEVCECSRLTAEGDQREVGSLLQSATPRFWSGINLTI